MYAIYKSFTAFTNHTLSDCDALGNVIKCYVIEWICIIILGAIALIVIFYLIIKNKYKFWDCYFTNKKLYKNYILKICL